MSRVLLCLFVIILISVSDRSNAESGLGDYKIYDDGFYHQMVPSFMINHAGFLLPSKDNFIAIDGIDLNKPIFPTFPLIKKSFFSTEVAGVVIPEQFLDLKPIAEDDSTELRIDTTKNHVNVKVNQAMDMVARLGLTPFFYNNRVLGIDKKYKNIQITKRTGFGLRFSLSNLTLDDFVLEEKHGLEFNVAAQLQSIFAHTKNLIEGDKTQEAVQAVLRYLPYVRFHLAANSAKSKVWSNLRIDLQPAIQNALYEGEYEIVHVPHSIHKTDFSSELNELRSKLSENLEEEEKWRATVRPIAGSTFIVDSKKNLLIQQLCDYLAESVDFPKEIWPRCRIASTLEPNAYAMPGGEIFVTAGLIGVISDMDGLLMVLGHELGHVLARHVSRSFIQGVIANTSLNILGLAGSLIALGAGPIGMPALGTINLAYWIPESLVAGEVSGLGLHFIGLGILAGFSAYSRAAEWESDRIGHQLALATGAHQSGLNRSWEEFITFVQKYFKLDPSIFDKIFAGHPDSVERGEKLRERALEYRALVENYRNSVGTHANRLNETFYKSYGEAHELFHKMAESFGAAVLAEARKGNTLVQKYASESLSNPGGLCIYFALAGVKGN